MIKVGIVGAPSTGKTTLAEGISFHYKSKGNLNRVSLISEYAREFVKDFNIPTTADQYHILNKQLENERMADGANLMVTDSPFWLSYIYGCHVASGANDREDKDNYYLNQIHHQIIDKLKHYDIIFYLPYNFDFIKSKNIKDGQRVHDDCEIIRGIDKKIVGFMNLHGVFYNEIEETDAEERLKKTISIIDRELEF